MNATRSNLESKLLTGLPMRSGAIKDLPLENRGISRVTVPSAIEEIHVRAETVTPLLREILEFCPPPIGESTNNQTTKSKIYEPHLNSA